MYGGNTELPLIWIPPPPHSSAAPTGAASVGEIRWSVSSDFFPLGMPYMQRRTGLSRLPEGRLRYRWAAGWKGESLWDRALETINRSINAKLNQLAAFLIIDCFSQVKLPNIATKHSLVVAPKLICCFHLSYASELIIWGFWTVDQAKQTVMWTFSIEYVTFQLRC